MRFAHRFGVVLVGRVGRGAGEDDLVQGVAEGVVEPRAGDADALFERRFIDRRAFVEDEGQLLWRMIQADPARPCFLEIGQGEDQVLVQV